MEGGRQIDRQNLVPLVDRELIDWRHVLDAGVVDQDIHPAKPCLGRGDHGGDGRAVCHVRAVIGRLDPEFGLDTGAFGLDGGGVAKPVENHICPFPGHGAGDGQADPAGGSGDQGGLVCEGHSQLRGVWKGRGNVMAYPGLNGHRL